MDVARSLRKENHYRKPGSGDIVVLYPLFVPIFC